MDYFGLGRIISESVGLFQTPSLSDDSDSFGLDRTISEFVGFIRNWSDHFRLHPFRISDDSDSFGLDRNSSDFVGLIRNPDRNLPIYELQNHAKVRKFFMKSENFL